MLRRFLFAISRAVQLILFVPAAFAGHPMLSEDSGTQGTGNAELEFGFDWSRDHGNRAFLFQPQLSYGTSPTLDLIVQPSWLSVENSTNEQEHGFGDTNLDMKWRFYGAAPLSFALRAGFDLPTNQNDLGLPHDNVSPHALLAATFDAAPYSFDANVGYTFGPKSTGLRTDLYHVSLAASFAFNEQVMLIVDTAADSNPDPRNASWPVVALAGIIYTVAPGFDIDAGYRAALNSAAIEKQWLFGMTYRWAP